MALTTFKPLTRDQLAKFLPDQEAIRRFEQLFSQAGETIPAEIIILFALTQELSIEANDGITIGNEALAQCQFITDYFNAQIENNSIVANKVFNHGSISSVFDTSQVNFSSDQNIIANQVFGY